MAATLTTESAAPLPDSVDAELRAILEQYSPSGQQGEHATSLPEGNVEFQNILKNNGLDASSLKHAVQQAEEQGIDWDAELKKLDSQSEKSQGSATISAQEKHGHSHGKKKKNSKLKEIITDFAYSLNHAIVCTLTDPITDIPIGAVVSGAVDRAEKNRKNGENTPFIPFVKNQLKEEWDGIKTDKLRHFTKEFSFKKEDKEEDAKFTPGMSWLMGEFAGDFGAVFATVAVKHFASPIAKGIEWLVRPIAEPLFRRSIKKSMAKQFDLYGLDKNSPIFEQAVEDSVKSEVKELPNAVLWTILSPVINVTLQKKVLKNPDSYKALYAGKIVGSITTSSLTVGLRSLAPSFAQKWDEGLSTKTAGPVSKALGVLPGIHSKELRADLIKQIKDEHGMDKESFLARYGDAKRPEPTKAASHTERENTRPATGVIRGA